MESSSERRDSVEWIKKVPAVFAKRVQVVRKARLQQQGGYTQAYLAHLMSYRYGHESWRQTTWAKIEAGERDVKLDEALSMCHLLGVELDDMVSPGMDINIAAAGAGRVGQASDQVEANWPEQQ